MISVKDLSIITFQRISHTIFRYNVFLLVFLSLINQIHFGYRTNGNHADQ